MILLQAFILLAVACIFGLCSRVVCKQKQLILPITGVGTKIDPTLCRADRMVGQVLGAVGALPDIFIELEISYFLLRRLLGVRTEGDKKGAKVTATDFSCHFTDCVQCNCQ